MKRKGKKLNVFKVIIAILIIAIICGVFIKITHKKEENVETSSKTKVEDTEAPKINLNGNSEEIIIYGEDYEEKGASATDNVDGDITDKIETDGNVDANKVGNYEIKYSVKDEAGNNSEITRNVKVCNKLSSNGLPILMYHFFYDKNTGKGKDNNWIEISDFEKQIKYLSENDYYFPSWEEVKDYIDGETELPEKSIVITADDADPSFFELAVPVLNKYNINATSFVITGWYGYRYNEERKNVIYESHSDDMHEAGANGKGRMLNWSYNDVLKDLKQSSQILGGADIYCYPFGQYNDENIKAVKEAGYKLAVTTQEGRVKKGAKKYELPRVRISRNTSLESFKEKIK